MPSRAAYASTSVQIVHRLMAARHHAHTLAGLQQADDNARALRALAAPRRTLNQQIALIQRARPVARDAPARNLGRLDPRPRCDQKARRARRKQSAVAGHDRRAFRRARSADSAQRSLLRGAGDRPPGESDPRPDIPAELDRELRRIGVVAHERAGGLERTGIRAPCHQVVRWSGKS